MATVKENLNEAADRFYDIMVDQFNPSDKRAALYEDELAELVSESLLIVEQASSCALNEIFASLDQYFTYIDGWKDEIMRNKHPLSPESPVTLQLQKFEEVFNKSIVDALIKNCDCKCIGNPCGRSRK